MAGWLRNPCSEFRSTVARKLQRSRGECFSHHRTLRDLRNLFGSVCTKAQDKKILLLQERRLNPKAFPAQSLQGCPKMKKNVAAEQVSLVVRVPPDCKTFLETLADFHCPSMSAVVVQLLRAAMAAEARASGAPLASVGA
jgi:hypothetical protein